MSSHSTKTVRVCTFEGCGKPHMGRGLCKGHWQQQRLGKPLLPLYSKKRLDGTLPRIRYDESPCPNDQLEGPCHVFRGHKNADGYCPVNFNNSPVRVHRYVWELANGLIPDGMVIDHMCRNRACCNVAHLRVVTQKVNALENSLSLTAVNAAKTHCKYGHEFTAENTYRYKGERQCRLCKRVRDRLAYQAKRRRQSSEVA